MTARKTNSEKLLAILNGSIETMILNGNNISIEYVLIEYAANEELNNFKNGISVENFEIIDLYK